MYNFPEETFTALWHIKHLQRKKHQEKISRLQTNDELTEVSNNKQCEIEYKWSKNHESLWTMNTLTIAQPSIPTVILLQLHNASYIWGRHILPQCEQIKVALQNISNMPNSLCIYLWKQKLYHCNIGTSKA